MSSDDKPKCFGIGWDAINEQDCRDCLLNDRCRTMFAKVSIPVLVEEFGDDVIAMSKHTSVSEEALRLTLQESDVAVRKKRTKKTTKKVTKKVTKKTAEASSTPPKRKRRRKKPKEAEDPVNFLTAGPAQPAAVPASLLTKQVSLVDDVAALEALRSIQAKQKMTRHQRRFCRFRRERQRNMEVMALFPGVLLHRTYKGVTYRLTVGRMSYLLQVLTSKGWMPPKNEAMRFPTLHLATLSIDGRLRPSWRPLKNGSKSQRLMANQSAQRFWQLPKVWKRFSHFSDVSDRLMSALDLG